MNSKCSTGTILKLEIKFKDRYWGPATAWVRIVKDENKNWRRVQWSCTGHM